MTSAFRVVDRDKTVWDVIPMDNKGFQVRPADAAQTANRVPGSLKPVDDVRLVYLTKTEVQEKLSSLEWSMENGSNPPVL